MGWFSDFFTFENLAPIAAGALTGGLGYGLMAATAAGAGTGAGLAALRGEDIATGAISGGLGGFSGGGLGTAFNPAAAGSAPTSSQLATTGGKSGMTMTNATYNPVLASGDVARQSVFAGKGIGDAFSAGNYGEALGGVGTGFKEGVQNLGGGSTLQGAGKLASMGVMGAGIGGIQNQQPMVTEDFMPEKYKYDPTRRLNLGDDVDSGLRLIAKGGYIGNNYATGGYLEGGGIPEAVSVTETDTMSMEPDGMSDSIAATIDQEQPAALSEGEFVIPADVVSFAGNGSSEAGAKRFYKMLGDIREASTGQREQIKEIDVEKYMPMGGGLGTLV
jgi:hypothetical protein